MEYNYDELYSTHTHSRQPCRLQQQQQQQQRAVQKLVVVSFFAKIYSPEMTSQTRGKKPNSFGSIISDDDVYNFLYLLK
jgi:hypothetical protein